MITSVKKYYTQDAEYEWNRLESDEYHKLEYNATLFFLKKDLLKNGIVMDAGECPGRYTINLAKRGYVDIIERIGLEGFTHVPNEVNNLLVGRPNALRNWEEVHLSFCTNPSIYATMTHMMFVLKKTF